MIIVYQQSLRQNIARLVCQSMRAARQTLLLLSMAAVVIGGSATHMLEHNDDAPPHAALAMTLGARTSRAGIRSLAQAGIESGHVLLLALAFIAAVAAQSPGLCFVREDGSCSGRCSRRVLRC